ncbi:MAG TPA: phenylalanine--tRNA ligase beta subunit-related protein [Acetobacteraceae bacterium]|nr:phenylalanine--tRNA ligase beta subunit-related protein [Acetobacteraceae bacterium]
MHLRIDPAIFHTFPGTLIGVVVARGIDNSGEAPEARAALRAAEASLPARFGTGPVTEHPAVAPWREAYRRFGARPKDHPSSIENLVRRVMKGQALPHINPLVDVYNTVSLLHLLPAGGENLDALQGDLHLTFAGPDEPAVRLLGEPEARAPVAGEVIYRDDVGAVCRRWNWKEAERTKLTPATRNALLVLEALPPAGAASLEAALADLARGIAAACGGAFRTALLDASYPDLDLAAPE